MKNRNLFNALSYSLWLHKYAMFSEQNSFNYDITRKWGEATFFFYFTFRFEPMNS